VRRRKLDECIKELRFQGNIPKIWSALDLKPFLVGLFSKHTLSVFPNNFSISPDGLTRGDAVKRGMKPKYCRLGLGKFVLLEEYATGLDSQPKAEEINPLFLQSKSGEEKAVVQQEMIFRRKKDLCPRGGKSVSKSLLTIFPTKIDLLNYADLCAVEYRKNSDSLNLYHSIIVRQRDTKLVELLQDQNFLDLIYKTLMSWDMNYRRAKLMPFPEFSSSIRKASAKIVNLAEFEMGCLEKEQYKTVMARLEDVFGGLQVMASKSRIVGVSKTLHFLLPRLVMPIDGKYTLKLLYGYRVYKPSLIDEMALFREIYFGFWGLATQLGLSRSDEQAEGWNTTVPKIIDNAIIGYVRNRKS
jgi:hypothetical protein